MATTLDYKSYSYIKSKELATVMHFEITSKDRHHDLSERLKISKDRGFSQASGMLFWLHLREETKWSRPLTGLRPVGNNCYYGDIKLNGKKSLLLFQFDSENELMVIDVFKGFYPSHRGVLIKLVQNHQYQL